MAAWAAGAAGGHVGRARRLARDEAARLGRKAVLDIPLALDSLAACLTAAEDLVASAQEEADAAATRLDAPETEAVKASRARAVEMLGDPNPEVNEGEIALMHRLHEAGEGAGGLPQLQRLREIRTQAEGRRLQVVAQRLREHGGVARPQRVQHAGVDLRQRARRA